jgi:hypothetical protein
MNPERLLKYFDRIADAPAALPRLRRFILDLAMRGKLVEQDPNDEPASELLKRIQAEKARFVRGLKTSEIDDSEAPSTLPKNWVVVPLIALAPLTMPQQHGSELGFIQRGQLSSPRLGGPLQRISAGFSHVDQQ